MFKILVSDKLSDKGLEILRTSEEVEINSCPGIPHKEICQIIKDYDAILIRSGTKVNAEIIEKGKNLKLIGRAGVGVDNVDIAAASKRGIIVMNTPDGNTITTAEHTISMIMSLARRIPLATVSMRAEKWEKKKFIGTELRGKVLGIVGLGRIGRAIALRLKGFGMEIIAFDTYTQDSIFEESGIRKVEFDELLRISDFITVHTPLTPETKYLLDKNAFAKMKKSVRVINCARGGIVNEKDLCVAIKDGVVAGAAIDVFEKEPPLPDNPLFSMKEIITTPHLGASTREAQENVSVNVARQALDYLINGVVVNSVNVPSITRKMSKVIKPFQTLAEKVGKFAAQLSIGKIKKISLKYYVNHENFPISIIKSFLLKGILEISHPEDNPTWISAFSIVKEKGILFEEERLSSSPDYSNLIRCEIKTDRVTRVISGAVVHNSLRIVQIEKFAVEVVPFQNVLIIYNYDRPTIVGNIGRFLGENGININNMQFGRESSGGDAITIFEIDVPLSSKMLLHILRFPDIRKVAQINL